jgi:hypothetical protein
MTCGTSLRNAQKSFAQILRLDERATGRGNMIGVMTLTTGQTCVFPLKRISRLLVIERTWIPLYD